MCVCVCVRERDRKREKEKPIIFILLTSNWSNFILFLFFNNFTLCCKVHCVACGYLRGKDGKVITASSSQQTLPLPPPLKPIQSLSAVLPTVISKKRKDNVHFYTESDDDEDADDSMAYSTYVQSRLGQLHDQKSEKKTEQESEPEPKFQQKVGTVREQSPTVGSSRYNVVNQSTIYNSSNHSDSIERQDGTDRVLFNLIQVRIS